MLYLVYCLASFACLFVLLQNTFVYCMEVNQLHRMTTSLAICWAVSGLVDHPKVLAFDY